MDYPPTKIMAPMPKINDDYDDDNDDVAHTPFFAFLPTPLNGFL